MVLLTAVLSAVTLVGCQPAQAPERQLTYGRDWYLPTPSPTAIEATPIVVQESSGELDSPKPTTVAVATPPATPVPIPYSPRPPRVSESLGEEQLRSILRQAGWPEELHEAAVNVAWCESRWHSDAVGGGQYLGLFQLWSGWFRYSGLDESDWSNPITNARAAYGAFLYSKGWGQWQCQP